MNLSRWVRTIAATRPAARPVTDLTSLRRRLIGELVVDKTFAEVGGLWGTVNETVSVAMQAGAREATMIDFQAAGNPLWVRFHERCRELGLSGYHTVVGNICDARLADDVGQFDVVHCAGVLYHTPNPVDVIRNLISITRERFILTSAVVPTRIANAAGTLRLSTGQMLLVPTLDATQRAILREYFHAIGRKGQGIVTNGRFVTEKGQLRGGPWWWLFTAETLIRMCDLFNVTIEQTWDHKKSNAVAGPTGVTVLARLNPSTVTVAER